MDINYKKKKKIYLVSNWIRKILNTLVKNILDFIKKIKKLKDFFFKRNLKKKVKHFNKKLLIILFY